MSDAKNQDEAIEDSGEEQELGQSKKKGGIAALLPKILKWGAIVIIIAILMVTTVILSVHFASRQGQSQTVTTDTASPYVGRRPTYVFFTAIGQVRTRTADPVAYSVSVTMNLGYTENDNATSSELNARLYELRDFVRTFFAMKTAAELAPENQERLKQEIMEYINTRLLTTGKVRIITFDSLDVSEM
jgi:flagellar FliL protein